MQADAYFALVDGLPITGLDEVLGSRGLLVVAPHPDDESLGCGGLLAAAAEAGIPVSIVFVSDGTKSHPNSLRFPKPRLRALREAEAREAVSLLGLDPIAMTFMRLSDGAVPHRGQEADCAALLLAHHLVEIDAAALFVTSPLDPHCDHQAAFTLAQRAVRRCRGTRLFAYSIWSRTLPATASVTMPPVRGFRLAVEGHLDRKRAAIAAHRSQTTALIDDDPEGFRLEAGVVEHFLRPHEAFIEMTP